MVEIKEGQSRPNKLFSNRNVRKALTHALDREEIVKEYLYDLIRMRLEKLYNDTVFIIFTFNINHGF